MALQPRDAGRKTREGLHGGYGQLPTPGEGRVETLVLHPSGDVRVWDGLLGWFLGYVRRHPEILASSIVRQCYRAGSSAPQLIAEIKSARTDNPTSQG